MQHNRASRQTFSLEKVLLWTSYRDECYARMEMNMMDSKVWWLLVDDVYNCTSKCVCLMRVGYDGIYQPPTLRGTPQGG